MSAIWLMVGTSEECRWMRAEIAARDGRARFMCVSELACLTEIARQLACERVCVAFALGADDEDRVAQVERAMSEIAREGVAGQLVGMMRRADARVAARCFRSGATEVMVAEGAEIKEDSFTGGGAKEEHHVCHAPSADDEVPDEILCEEAWYAQRGWEEEPPWDVPQPSDVPLTHDSLTHDSEAEQSGSQSACATDAPVHTNVCRGEADTGVRASGKNASAGTPAPAKDKSGEGARAPLVTVVSGRGGVGKTTLVASMAACAARAGLRAAVIDLDLMFGDLSEVFGIETAKGIEGLMAHADGAILAEEDIEASAMRVGPGLTLWGPCTTPERAELCSQSIEGLISVLRGLADVIFVDTSGCWGDAVAMAVSLCDRCLVVGSAGMSSATSARRVCELAERLGVPRTRMTGVFNRAGAKGCGEDQAMKFEMGVSLRSRVRIADGGDDVAGMLSFGQVTGLIAGSGAFAQSVRTFTCEMLKELGCPIAQWLLDEELARARENEGVRFRLPWKRKASDLL